MDVFDSGRAQIVLEATKSLQGAPAMEFASPQKEQLFMTCWEVEDKTPNNVTYFDRYMDIFDYSKRVAQLIRQKMSLDSIKTVADVAELAALEAGADSTDPRHYIALAMVILIKCEKFGEDLHAWFKTSIYYDYADPPRGRLVFPLYYLYEPTDAKKATLRWQWKK